MFRRGCRHEDWSRNWLQMLMGPQLAPAQRPSVAASHSPGTEGKRRQRRMRQPPNNHERADATLQTKREHRVSQITAALTQVGDVNGTESKVVEDDLSTRCRSTSSSTSRRVPQSAGRRRHHKSKMASQRRVDFDQGRAILVRNFSPVLYITVPPEFERRVSLRVTQSASVDETTICFFQNWTSHVIRITMKISP